MVGRIPINVWNQTASAKRLAAVSALKAHTLTRDSYKFGKVSKRFEGMPNQSQTRFHFEAGNRATRDHNSRALNYGNGALEKRMAFGFLWLPFPFETLSKVLKDPSSRTLPAWTAAASSSVDSLSASCSTKRWPATNRPEERLNLEEGS